MLENMEKQKILGFAYGDTLANWQQKRQEKLNKLLSSKVNLDDVDVIEKDGKLAVKPDVDKIAEEHSSDTTKIYRSFCKDLVEQFKRYLAQRDEPTPTENFIIGFTEHRRGEI